MLTLYVLPGCPYCGKVLREAKDLDITFETKNLDDEAVAQELLERGGKIQGPYLIDSETGIGMYESDDIIDYLHEHFGKETVE